MNTINLKQFCGDADIRSYLNEPFNDGHHTYATNGHIIVRVPLQESVSANDQVSVGLMLRIDELFDDEARYAACGPIPAYAVPAEYHCPYCAGKGVTKCPECLGSGVVELESDFNEYECDCKTCDGEDTKATVCNMCDGTGHNRHLRIPLTEQIGISYYYLTLIESLPDAKINLTGEPTGAVPFTFSGGIGAVMPMRGVTT